MQGDQGYNNQGYQMGQPGQVYPQQQNQMYGQPMQGGFGNQTGYPDQQGVYQQYPMGVQPQQGGQPQGAFPQQQMMMISPGQQMMGQQGQVMLVPVMPVPMVRTDANNEPNPIQVQCPKCQQTNTTQITYYRGKGTFCCMCILCMSVPCVCFLPLCVKDCQDKRHNCPNCGNIVGESAPVRAGRGRRGRGFGHGHRRGKR